MKKFLIIVISAALVAAIAIGGTLAYLSSNAGGTTLNNTFTTSTAGSKLDITLTETPVDSKTGLKTTGDPVIANSYPIIPGATMDKDPTVTVLANSAPCYVFVYVKDNVTVNGTDAATLGAIHSDWTAIDSTNYPGLYVYKSGTIVDTKSTDNKLPAVFSSITINSALTNADTKSTPAGGVNVKAYAYQASGDVDYTDSDTNDTDDALAAAISWYNAVKNA